jgi:hypothetical protein
MNEQDNKLADEISKQAEGKQNNNDVTDSVKDNSLEEVRNKLSELKKVNDALEIEQYRSEQLRAKQMAGGRANFIPEKSSQELAEEEAKRLIGMVR